MNPIIKYLTKENNHVIPEELFDILSPIVHDKDVNAYLTEIANTGITGMRMNPDHTGDALRIIIISCMAVGYMYGSEGNKTPTEVATDVLKDLNIKEQEEK
jgi:hypothetical protein